MSLDRIFKAYNKAEELYLASSTSPVPELYINRGIVHKFCDEYGAAISDYEKAEMLDPTCGAKRLKVDLEEIWNRMSQSIENKYRLKKKRLTSLLSILQANENENPSSTAQDFKVGKNDALIIGCIVVGIHSDGSTPPMILGCMDKSQEFFIVNLYGHTLDQVKIRVLETTLHIQGPQMGFFAHSNTQKSNDVQGRTFRCYRSTKVKFENQRK